LGVSFGLTAELLKFWKHVGMTPVYLRQTSNELTGEHSCIMLKRLKTDEKDDEYDDVVEKEPVLTESNDWLLAYCKDFRRRFMSLLSYECFRVYRPQMALEILHQKQFKEKTNCLGIEELDATLSGFDLNRLEKYANNMVDYHLIMDLVPKIAHLFFLNRLDVNFKAVQSALLLGLGLQHKTMDALRAELDSVDGDLKVCQLLAWFNQLIRTALQCLRAVQDKAAERGMVAKRQVVMEPVLQSMNKELADAERDVEVNQKKSLSLLKSTDLSQYAIKGSDDAWSAALKHGSTGIVSVQGKEKKRKLLDKIKDEDDGDSHGKKKKKFKQHGGDGKKKKHHKN